MAGPNINFIPNEPSLKDLLDYFKKDIKLDFNCHHIGTIESFDSTFQTAKVSINYTQTKLQIDSLGSSTILSTPYPVILECPVICLGGGTGSLTFPIMAGDECLVLFNDRDLDNWFNGSSSSAPATGRLHSFADAIVLVGVRSLSNVLLGYDTEAATLQLGDNSVKIFNNEIDINVGASNSIMMDETQVVAKIGSNTVTLDSSKFTASLGTTTLELDSTGKLKITNATGEFVAALYQLFTDIQNGTVTTMLGPMPLVMPTFATDLSTFQSFKA